MNDIQRLRTTTVRITAALAFAAIMFATLAPLQAGKITGFTWSSSVASVALDPVAAPVDPNNDNAVGPSPNEILVTQKAYTGIGPADIEFTVVPSGGVTEYVINEGVYNGTGIDWSAYRIKLGFGLGGAFSASPSGDGLDFDAPDYDTPSDFSAWYTTWAESEDVILASGGVFPTFNFTTPLFRFSIDVPDGISAFTIRQIPIAVPEPGMMTLALVGSLAFIRRHRSRQEAALGACEGR